MSVATLPFPPQSTTRRPFRLSLVLAARAAFQMGRDRSVIVISTITTRSARSDNTCEGGVEPTENIYKIRERAVARHLFSFPNSQNVVLSVLSVATLRVASSHVDCAQIDTLAAAGVSGSGGRGHKLTNLFS